MAENKNCDIKQLQKDFGQLTSKLSRIACKVETTAVKRTALGLMSFDDTEEKPIELTQSISLSSSSLSDSDFYAETDRLLQSLEQEAISSLKQLVKEEKL